MIRRAMAATGKTEHLHARCDAGVNTVNAVFNDKTFLRRDIHMPGRIEEKVWCGFASFNHFSIEDIAIKKFGKFGGLERSLQPGKLTI